MVNCSVLWCKNRSEQAKSHSNVTFHRFPKDPAMKRIWVKAVGRSTEWIPTTHSAICAIHFEQHLFSKSKNGFRTLLDKTAVPTLNLPYYVDMNKSLPTTSREDQDTSRKKRLKIEKKRVVCQKFGTTTSEEDTNSLISENTNEDSIETSELNLDKCTLYTNSLCKRLKILKENTKEKAMMEIDKLIYKLEQEDESDEAVTSSLELSEASVLNNPVKVEVKYEPESETEDPLLVYSSDQSEVAMFLGNFKTEPRDNC